MPTARNAGRGGAVVLAGIALFQVALAAGVPAGAAAWGGGHPGRLPRGLRAASALSAVALASLAVVAARPPDRLDARVRSRVLRATAATLGLGTVANAVSRSPVERLWSPVSAAGAMLLWRATTPDGPAGAR